MFVRLALEEERETVVELAAAAVAESASHVPFSADAVRDTFDQYLKTANPTFFVVEDRRELIAFLMASMSSYTFSDGLYATQEVLFVRPDKRGTRAAALLIKHLIRWSEKLGAIEITGGNDNNLYSERTARFLEHYGFKRVGFFMRREMMSAQHG